MADYIVKCVEKLHLDICDKEDELDELYDLAAMRHKRSLMNIYAKKSKEAMDNNIILADLLRAICTDIMNGNYKTYFNVTKCKISSIGEVKKEYSNYLYLHSAIMAKAFYGSGC